MDNLVIFIVGLAVTLIAGFGVITSQIFIAYKPPKYSHKENNKYALPVDKPI